MRVLALFASVVAVSALSGCATMHKLFHPWDGRPLDEAVRKYGPPSSQYVLSNGNTMYQWQTGSVARATANQDISGQKYVRVESSGCSIRMEVDATNTIRNSSKSGSCN